MAFNKEIVLNILHNNDNIKDAISLIEELDTKRQKSYLLDSENKPFAILCYYHKMWELTSETEYGIKSSTKTGLNTMCKAGNSKWTKQQKESVKDKSDLLVKLMDNLVKQEDVEQLNDKIEKNRKRTDLEGYTQGYTLEEVKLRLLEHNQLK